MDIGEIFAKKQKRTRTVDGLLDDGLAAERDRLVVDAALAEKQDAWLNRRPEAPVLKDRIRELDEKIAESKVAFTFQAMPRTRWVELTNEYKDENDEIDPEAFGPWLLSESSLDPKMTYQDCVSMWDDWSAGETEQLYIAAFRVNREVRDIPFISAAYDTTENSDSNSTTASPEE
jgi:hypothetical protein